MATPVTEINTEDYTETNDWLFGAEQLSEVITAIRKSVKEYQKRNPGASYQIILDCGIEEED